MPSAMNGNRTAQTASPDVGSAPGAVGQILLGGQSEVLKQVLGVIEKKLRNMEKKKGKLDDYQAKKNKGEGLNQDQLEALTKFQEIAHNLEFARELQKNFHVLGQDIQKAQKKSARREQLKREEGDQKRLKSVLELQYVLERLGDDSVRRELRQQGAAGGSPLLSDADLTALDDLYKLVGPDRDQNLRLSEQYEEASIHLWDLLEARDKAVVGTTYKALKETLDQVLQSGYFDKAPPHSNGLCGEEEEEEEEEDEEEEEEEVAVAVAVDTTTETDVAAAAPSSPEAEDQAVVDAEVELIEDYTEPIEVEATEFVNRQFIPDDPFSSSDKEQGDEWTTSETEMSIPSQAVGAMQPHLVQTTPPPPPAPAPLEPPAPHPALTLPPAVAVAPPTTDPLVRKQVVQDLMAQMQGTYNFMQDSMLEFDGQPMDPAIVSVQTMKPAQNQNVDLPQMVCPPVHPESRLSQPNPVSVQPEPTQVAIISTPPPMFQTSHTPDPRPATEPIDPIQPSMSLGSEQPPPPSTSLPPVVSQTPPAFQTVSKAPPPPAAHSGGINVNAAPFQSMQAVFNLNAPVPPANETEALNPASQYQNSYSSSQGFNGQSQPLPVEQVDMPSEQLQSVGAFHSQDQPAGHAGATQQNPAFGRPQSFYNSRGMSRGGPRNARGMINGYRGSSNGFRGGYDYRPPFASTPNSGYGQTQFSAPRDYPNGNYQRDGYQQSNYKRGSSQGPRGAPRGTGQALRS